MALLKIEVVETGGSKHAVIRCAASDDVNRYAVSPHLTSEMKTQDAVGPCPRRSSARLGPSLTSESSIAKVWLSFFVLRLRKNRGTYKKYCSSHRQSSNAAQIMTMNATTTANAAIIRSVHECGLVGP